MAVNIDEVEWRQVTETEYENADFRVPHRSTYAGGIMPIRYELGTVPLQLPTKTGAVVAPPSPNHDGYLPYFLSSDGWSLVDGTGAYSVNEAIVRHHVKAEGFRVVFEGYDV